MTEPTLRTCILSMASLVTTDNAEARHWYRCEPIARLGEKTAHELVSAGQGLEVLDFLFEVLRHELQS